MQEEDQMGQYVIVGAGPVGTATAMLLAESGHTVKLVSRSGSGPSHDGVERVAADAADAERVTALCHGAAALINAANPVYTRWPTDWPPIAAALLAAAETSGAVLVTMSNLYGYGPLDHPMRETDPLATTGKKGRVRVSMWQDALAAHQAGRARVTEARASDFFGPEVTGSHLGDRVVPKVLEGKAVTVLGDPDAPHTWSYVPDVARTLVVLADDERAWGHPWHVPSNEAASARQMVAAFCRAAGVQPAKVKGLPNFVLTAGGLVSPLLRELKETRYQFERPFVMDSSAATATFGITPTPLDEAAAATVAWFRNRPPRAA